MAFRFMRDLVIENSPKQAALVDPLFEESPILQSMPMMPSSHTFANVYEEIKDINGAAIVDLDSPLPVMTISTGIKRTELKIMGGRMEVGEDKAQSMGGPGKYFGSKISSCLKAGGKAAEKEIIYNTLRKFAIDSGKVADIGGSSGKNYSILCVKWGEGENTGLFSPNFFGKGMAFDTRALCGGNSYVNSEGVIVFGQRAKSAMGIQLAMEKHIAGLVNIDISSATQKKPSAEQIDAMLVDSYANPANTIIYMHPSVLTVIKAFKRSALNMAPSDRRYDTQVSDWDGIPIITSYNFLKGTEANVTVA